MAIRSGAQIIWESLMKEGVEVVFGYPGGTILPAYDAMLNYPSIHHVLTRHEQGATHAADGYARASGKVGVAIATSGPGATNMTTGIANAMLDSVPLVCITGQVGTSVIGSDAFQEVDVTGVTLPITKHNYLVRRVEDLAATIREAFHIARSDRPGPVLVDIPKDVQIARCEFVYPDTPFTRPRHHAVKSLTDSLERSLEWINKAERPVILAGHGVLISGAMDELREFAEKTQIPVALTLLGLGVFPAGHPLCLGMMGMHGEAYANRAVQSADLLVAMGMRFDDRVTGNLKTYAKHAKKIHIEIDASEVAKNVRVDLPILGDLKTVLLQMNPRVVPGRYDAWRAQIAEWRAETEARDIQQFDDSNRLLAPHVINDLWEATEGKALIVSDVGQNQMWEAQYYRHETPRSLITSGGLGTMGFALPAAIGAKFARPDAEVWVTVGDGGFQMTLPELATMMQEKLKINIAILNNGFLGMVRQWQEFFYERRYAATPILSPDFCKLAEAYGIEACRVTRREEVIPTIQMARQNPGPVLIDFRVEAEEAVYPMVPAGADLHEMIRRPAPVKS